MLAFDWSLVGRYGPSFLAGAAMTLSVSVISTLVGLALGLAAALARLSPWRVLRVGARVYVEVVRGTPLLVQLFFVYAALPFYGIRLSALTAGVVALSLYCGAYAAEIFRAGITAVHRGHVEAARSLGMSYAQTIRRIVGPIMAALVHRDYAAQRAIGETYSAIEPLVVSGLLYWVLNDLVVAAGRTLERRLTRHLV